MRDLIHCEGRDDDGDEAESISEWNRGRELKDRENEGSVACGCGEAKEEHMNPPSDTLLPLLLFLEN